MPDPDDAKVIPLRPEPPASWSYRRQLAHYDGSLPARMSPRTKLTAIGAVALLLLLCLALLACVEPIGIPIPTRHKEPESDTDCTTGEAPESDTDTDTDTTGYQTSTAT